MNPHQSSAKAFEINGSAWRVTRAATAWDSIGHDGGAFRIQNGTALYDAVIYNCATARSNNVVLARLGNYVGTKPVGVEQHSRRVHPDTLLEFLTPNSVAITKAKKRFNTEPSRNKIANMALAAGLPILKP